MFKKILIANRGEIACRIIRTCRELGIRTVAVYSEADKDALHVDLADEAFFLGASRVSESYLNINKIIDIAVKCKADAIHPGYGLLSENAMFARRCEEEKLVFIGPSSTVIERMGSKIEARKAMQAAGVPIVQGVSYPLRNLDEAKSSCQTIGYPVMLKASAGGGGIGMQIIYSETELRAAFEGNQKRAKSYFGNDEMFIEKYIKNPRHIEIQILADELGNTVFLWERECSIQRRHQKILEEAPSPFIDDSLRFQMGKAAIKAAQNIGYKNAGTVEFLVDDQKKFYFLEMNTRLQVEHPITEEITGIDLVEEQIRVASGEPLRFRQEEIKRTGHAIEVRIYAEDPVTFLPSPGKIKKLSLPKGKGIRHELGVHGTSVISPFYDPMIGKLIVTGADRPEAIIKLKKALAEYSIVGIKTNLPLLKDIAEHPEFCSGNTDTGFIKKYIRK